MSKLIGRLFTPKRAVAVLTLINVLNYVDRGIIAGAGTDIRGCVNSTADCSWMPLLNTSDYDCGSCAVCGTTCDGKLIVQTGFGINEQQLGYLQSSFMIGYTLAAIGFGHLVHVFDPFTLMFMGLSAWIVSAACSSLSGFACNYAQSTETGELCDTFYTLLLARVLSGAGEASTATLAVPLMDDILDKKSKGFFFAMYFAAVPFGTALGFVYAGVMASVTGRWEWAFWCEFWPMIPLSLIVLMVPRNILRKYQTEDNVIEGDMFGENEVNMELEASVDESLSAPFLQYDETQTGDDMLQVQESSVASTKVVTLCEDLMSCLCSPVFILTSLGYAQYTATTAGLAFYGPKFVQSYRPGDPNWKYSQVQADVVFGTTVAFAGLIGTALGGVIMDRFLDGVRETERCKVGLRLAVLESAVGFCILMCVPFITDSRIFFGVLAIGITAVFACNTTASMVTLYSVPSTSRAMSMALSILFLHLLGDVPSPIVIGWISDHESPKFTLLVTTLWFAGTVLFWGLALLVAERK